MCKPDSRHVVEVEVDKQILESWNRFEITCGFRKVERSTAMPRALGNTHTGRPHGFECLHGGMNQDRIRIDHAPGFELNEIRLEHDIPAAYVQVVKRERAQNRFVNILCITRLTD